MGVGPSVVRVNFEDVKAIASSSPNSQSPKYLVSTLADSNQACLIDKTLTPADEVRILNECIRKGAVDCTIIVYGKDCSDMTIDKKAAKLQGLGFRNVCTYAGGMLEWLLLQEIYGKDHFPTRGSERDLLRYHRTASLLQIKG